MQSAQTIEELCSAVVDCPHSTPKWTDEGVVVLRSTNIRNGRLDLSSPSYTDEEHYRERIRRAVPEPGDLVLTREAPMGEVCMIPEGLRCCLGQRMVLLKPDTSKVNPRYLLYAIQSRQVQTQILASEGTGSTVSNLRIPLLKALRIPHHSLPSQGAIADILGALDDKIELNRRMSETLEDIATTVFQSWFVAFDGAEQLVQSSLGLTPEGWRVEPLGNLIQVAGGATPSTKEPRYWDGGRIPWATPKDLSGHEGPILLTTARRVTEAGLERISSGLLPKGTLLFSSRAPIGYRALAGQATTVNQGFIAVPPGSDLSPTYMYFWTHANLDVIKGHAGGSTFAEISKRAFKSIPTVLPPMELRLRFDEVAGMLLKRCELLARESTTLIELRDTLLPKLISGELRVPQAEQLVSEVV